MRIQDRLEKLRNKRGFTLVELMIVVAIIGVLAALAIYGVRKYLTNAKTAEARMAVGRMAKDGGLAYEKESVEEGIIPLRQEADVAHKLCTSALSAVPAAAPINKKYQSTPEDWKTPNVGPALNIPGGWNCIKFTMGDPQYFSYRYTLDVGDNTGVAAAAAGDIFSATAHGNLDGDAAESTFTLNGQVRQDPVTAELILSLAATITELEPEE